MARPTGSISMGASSSTATSMVTSGLTATRSSGLAISCSDTEAITERCYHARDPGPAARKEHLCYALAARLGGDECNGALDPHRQLVHPLEDE